MINNTPINNNNNNNFIAQNTGQPPVGIIQNHLSTNKFNVIETKFPSTAGVLGSGFDQIGEAEGSGYVKELKFIVRNKDDSLSQKTYSQIRQEPKRGESISINRRDATFNIVGIVERDGDVYGVEDVKSSAKNEAVFNRNATGPETLFTDPKGKDTLTGAILKKLN